MKKLVVAVLLLVTLTTSAFACEWVNGYFRKDGTWVEGYWRNCK